MTSWPDHHEKGELAEQAYSDFYGSSEPVCTSCLDQGLPELHERIARIPREIQERKESAAAELKRRQHQEWEAEQATNRRLRRQVIAFAQTSEAKRRSTGVFKRRWYLGTRTHTSTSASEYHGYPVTSSTQKVWLYADGSTTPSGGDLHTWESEIKNLFWQCGFTPPE